MRIAFFGTSAFVGSVRSARLLRRIVDGGLRPAVVVTAPDVPSGRGTKPVPSAVKSAALELGLPALEPATLKGFSEELARREIELSLVAAYGKILPPEVLAVPKFGSLNVHPSLLPRWRGASPVQATILAGDAVTGVTIIQMDEKMDHGPIVAQREFPLGGRDWTAPKLSDALADLGVELFLETLDPWVGGRIKPRVQDESLATYTKPLRKEDGRVDWHKDAREIERMTRAFLPWPSAFTFWQQGAKRVRLVIEQAEEIENLEPRIQSKEIGAVFEYNGGLGVRCGKGALVLKRLKPEGGQSMDGTSFLRGHRDIIGSILT